MNQKFFFLSEIEIATLCVHLFFLQNILLRNLVILSNDLFTDILKN